MSENVGIPTLYRHTQFRSRLEARWAAFFDLVDWDWEYEPLDLPGWIPDFIIFCPGGYWTYGECPHKLPKKNIFVEVKPIDDFDDFEDRQKVFNALKQSKYSGTEVLVLGYRIIEYGPCVSKIGWLMDFMLPSEEARYDYGFDGAHIALYNNGSWGLEAECGSFTNRITGRRDCDKPGRRWESQYDLDTLWAKAGNEVQYKRNRVA